MRIIVIIVNFPFLTSCSCLNKWNTLVYVDGLWVAIEATPGHHYFSGFMASHTAPPYHRYGLSVGFDGAHFLRWLGKALSPDGSSWLHNILWKSPLSLVGTGLFTMMPVETHNFLWDLLWKTLFNTKDKRRQCLISTLNCSWLSYGSHNQHLRSRLLVTYPQCR